MADRPSASTPTRTCVGCRTRAPQSDLVRVVARPGQEGSPTGWIAWLDLSRRHPGRGAYLHPSLTCLDLAERLRALPRALRLSGALDLERLRLQMTSVSGDGGRPKAGRDGDEHAMSAQQ